MYDLHANLTRELTEAPRLVTARRISSGRLGCFAVSLMAAMSLTLAAVRAATLPEACSLLSQQEVAAAAGFGVAPPDLKFKTVCSWLEPGKGPTGKNVQVSFLSETVYQAGKTMRSATTQPEAGLGDEAYFILQSMGVPRLDVRKGDIYFRVQVRAFEMNSSNSGDDKKKEMEIDRAIARLILQRL